LQASRPEALPEEKDFKGLLLACSKLMGYNVSVMQQTWQPAGGHYQAFIKQTFTSNGPDLLN